MIIYFHQRRNISICKVIDFYDLDRKDSKFRTKRKGWNQKKRT